jgi:hypothetical protein
MWKVCSALAVLVTSVAACAHSGDMPTVRTGNDPDTSKARVASRTAAAGGSHAPAGEIFSSAGSAR